MSHLPIFEKKLHLLFLVGSNECIEKTQLGYLIKNMKKKSRYFSLYDWYKNFNKVLLDQYDSQWKQKMTHNIENQQEKMNEKDKTILIEAFNKAYPKYELKNKAKKNIVHFKDWLKFLKNFWEKERKFSQSAFYVCSNGIRRNETKEIDLIIIDDLEDRKQLMTFKNKFFGGRKIEKHVLNFQKKSDKFKKNIVHNFDEQNIFVNDEKSQTSNIMDLYNQVIRKMNFLQSLN